MKTKKELLKESVDHYERMIKWYMAHEPTGTETDMLNKAFSFAFYVAHIMRKDINESWGGGDCALCKTYYISDFTSPSLDSCGDCPINIDGHPNCRRTHWQEIQHAVTKSQLLKALMDEQAYLRKLYYKEKN
jgi:hypothetical protein